MKKSAVLVSAIAFDVACLDGVFKYFALRLLPPDTLPVSWPFGLALHKNPGITFDLAIPLWLVIPFTLIILVWLGIFVHQNWSSPKAVSALIIIFGATGNLIDRLVNGFTTDYIILFGRSAINLADVLIITGAIGLLYYTKNNSPVTGET